VSVSGAAMAAPCPPRQAGQSPVVKSRALVAAAFTYPQSQVAAPGTPPASRGRNHPSSVGRAGSVVEPCDGLLSQVPLVPAQRAPLPVLHLPVGEPPRPLPDRRDPISLRVCDHRA